MGKNSSQRKGEEMIDKLYYTYLTMLSQRDPWSMEDPRPRPEGAGHQLHKWWLYTRLAPLDYHGIRIFIETAAGLDPNRYFPGSVE